MKYILLLFFRYPEWMNLKILSGICFITAGLLVVVCSSVSLTISKENFRNDKLNKITTFAFGSCADQNKPQPVLVLAADTMPDFFLYLGDNVYNHSEKIQNLKKCYQILGAKPEFIKLKKVTRIFATWDDHDYGWNDSGNDYPYKELSKKYFIEFFGVPDNSIFEHKGIYYNKIIDYGERRVQIIMLDTRTFRDKLIPYRKTIDDGPRFNYRMNFSPHKSDVPTMLGEDQWLWLEKQLLQKADLRLICTSTQFAASFNGYETWANFPHQQQRMISIIRKTRAEGVIFISGDIHYAEISLLKADNVYPLYDITSSGITSTWQFSTPNENRIDGPVMENNFGHITVNWKPHNPEIIIRIYDVNRNLRIHRTLGLNSLRF